MEAANRKREDGVGSAAPGPLGQGQVTALWVASFLDELACCGVREAVVSPGSRSTPLAMAAFELSCREPDRLRLYIDVDERGAAYFGLGLAKASGRPVVLICTSGTATANYYPAVIEAETSRVPLVVLTGDRPPRLQGLGAPQTTDQLNLYGNHVRAFRAMPMPGADETALAFARQAAREAVLEATGGFPAWGREGVGPSRVDAFREHEDAEELVQVASRGCEHMAGPVQINFPFDEPLKPDFAGADQWVRACVDLASPVPAIDAFSWGRSEERGVLASVHRALDAETRAYLSAIVSHTRTLVLAGEGTCSTLDEARLVARWARAWNLPVLADPLSGMRMVDDPLIIDAYDAVFAHEDCPLPQTVIRFGRWPVSKRATMRLAACGARTVVVDEGQTRDQNAKTDVFVPLSPLDFVRDLLVYRETYGSAGSGEPFEELVGKDFGAHGPSCQREFADEWVLRDRDAGDRLVREVEDIARDVSGDGLLHEGVAIDAVLAAAPSGSCLFAANSMTVRNVDTFLRCGGASLCVMANRGQNGIDGTLSTALGAAQHFRRTTFITGDLTLQHDINALALQHELLRCQPSPAPSMVIVLLNNDGGAIFDMLPQASEDPYFQRLFLTPQGVDFQHAAAAFGVPYRRARSREELLRCYEEQLEVPGISLIEVRTPLRGLKGRLGGFWK